MGSFIDTLTNPYIFVTVAILTIVSTFFTFLGVKERNVAMVFIGIGSGLPTFDVTSWKLWVAGTVICLIGWQIHSKMNSPV